MKKQYLLPKMNLLIFIEDDVLTDSALTAVERAKKDLNTKNDTSINMKSIVVLE